MLRHRKRSGKPVYSPWLCEVGSAVVSIVLMRKQRHRDAKGTPWQSHSWGVEELGFWPREASSRVLVLTSPTHLPTVIDPPVTHRSDACPCES